jgi:signal transduction histidine kinase/CheY-like chemotaxis protein
MSIRRLAVSLLVALSVRPAGAFPAAAPDVLLLMSYHPGNDWTGEIVRGLTQTMSSPGKAEIWVEYLDIRRRTDPERLDEFERHLARMHAGRRFAAVAACDDAAFEFLRDRGSRLFPSTPLAFCGVDEALGSTAPGSLFTGVYELYNYRNLTETIRRLHPDLRRMMIIHDGSVSGLTLHDRLLPFLAAAPPITATPLDTQTLTLGQLAGRLHDAQPGAAAIITTLSRDREHPYLPPLETYTFLGSRARIPLYTLTYSRPGQGILGASENTGFGHGGLLAQVLLRLLAGERPAAIARVRDSNAPLLFDYDELRRQGLSLRLILPPHRILNRPASFYEEYRWWIWGGVLFVSLQAAAIALLIFAVRRRRQAETVLRDALRHSEEAANLKSRFLANVSHELRTPLHGILGLSELLGSGELAEPQREYNRQIMQCTRGLSSIVNDLLDLAQIERSGLRLDPTPFELGPFLSEIAGFFRPRAAEAGLELQLLVEPGVPGWVSGVPGRIRQVLTNLVGNALKFTPAGSVRIRVLPANGEVRFEVSDTGVGVPPGQQRLIFEPFHQAGAPATRQAEGVGLGLAISRHLVELMGGRIGLESGPGGGATFWFELPLAGTPATVPPGAHEAGRKLRFDGRCILAVEDNAVSLMLLRRVLEKSGCRVQTARNGSEAVHLVQNGAAPDLILMDVQMPVMSGLDATRAIRRFERGRRIPIVALTANAAAEDRQRCLDCGMDDFLTKPIEPAAMLSSLERWLTRD